MYVFPWGKPGLLEHHDGPDQWHRGSPTPSRTRHVGGSGRRPRSHKSCPPLPAPGGEWAEWIL